MVHAGSIPHLGLVFQTALSFVAATCIGFPFNTFPPFFLGHILKTFPHDPTGERRELRDHLATFRQTLYLVLHKTDEDVLQPPKISPERRTFSSPKIPTSINTAKLLYTIGLTNPRHNTRRSTRRFRSRSTPATAAAARQLT